MSTSAATAVLGLHLLWLKRALCIMDCIEQYTFSKFCFKFGAPTLDHGTLFIPEEAKSSANASKIVSSLISPVVALPAN